MTDMQPTQNQPFQQLHRRFELLPESPESKRWVCETCGVMEPKQVTFGGKTRYIRQRCACELAEEKRREREDREQMRRAYMESQANHIYAWLGSRWADTSLRAYTFDNFDPTRQSEAFEVAKMFAENPDGTLVLHGSFGTGKSHLLAAICNAALSKRGVASLFTTAPTLFRAIQARIQVDEDYSELVYKAARTPLLVIDDIDKAKHTEFREEIYFDIIDQRVRAKRPIAISTNRLDELASFVGGAVCSRFKVRQIGVEMIGADYREEL